jgi:hypothetical protein
MVCHSERSEQSSRPMTIPASPYWILRYVQNDSWSGMIRGIGLFFLLLTGVRAQDELPPLRIDAGYASAYVFRGVERARDSAQLGLEFNRGNFRAGAWLNQPFDGDDVRETNLNAAYAWQPADALSLEVSLAHAWFAQVPGGGVDRSFEAGVSAILAPLQGFTPAFAYYHDFRFDADTTQLSMARSIALTKIGAFLELNFFAGLVNGRDWRPDAAGVRHRDSYGYWGGQVHLPYRVGPHSTMVAGVHYADTFGRSVAKGPFGRASAGKFWVTLGVNLDF